MCGIAAVYNHPKAAQHVLAMLGELRHRGQGSRGLAISSGTDPYVLPEQDAAHLLDDPRNRRKLHGHIALGHARYPTSGSEGDLVDTQPAFADGIGRRVVLVENGDTPVLAELRAGYHDLETTTEAEVLARQIVDDLEDGLTMIEALRRLHAHYDGAYALIVLDGDSLYLTRDPRGMRPLWFGRGTRRPGYEFFAAASEDEALRAIDVVPDREVLPGEIVVLGPDGIHTEPSDPVATSLLAHCLFELVYFTGVSSQVFDIGVEQFRYEVGLRVGARLHAAGLVVDAVTSVPDASNPFSEGVANGLGVPLTFGIIRVHPVRTFIDTRGSRRRSVRQKYKVSKRIRGQRVLICDDSVIRGSTMHQLAQYVRELGQSAELHLAVGSPPIVWPCYYGIDMKQPDDFIARAFVIDGVVNEGALAQHFGLASMTYATMEELSDVLRSLGVDPDHFCTACWSGHYPTAGGQLLAQDMPLN